MSLTTALFISRAVILALLGAGLVLVALAIILFVLFLRFLGRPSQRARQQQQRRRERERQRQLSSVFVDIDVDGTEDVLGTPVRKRDSMWSVKSLALDDGRAAAATLVDPEKVGVQVLEYETKGKGRMP